MCINAKFAIFSHSIQLYEKLRLQTIISVLTTYIVHNKESITLLCFDPNIGSRKYVEFTEQQLHLINNYVIFHKDPHQYITLIQSDSKEKIFLITS